LTKEAAPRRRQPTAAATVVDVMTFGLHLASYGLLASGQADGGAASETRQRRREARSRVYEPLVNRSGWSGLNRRVGRDDRGCARLERAVTVVT
jgi:hypothetical protein